MFITIIIASVIGGIFSMIGGVILLINEKFAQKASLFLLSFAIGTLIGAAFFELLPEAVHGAGEHAADVFVFAVFGILALFVVEKTIKWYHTHGKEDLSDAEAKTYAPAILIGDAIHNFVDGIIIALAFYLDFAVGVATTVAIFMHEVPQEVADFGVLIHAGWARMKVLGYNLLVAAATPVGAIAGYLALPVLSGVISEIAAFAAGVFIYIAISDLMPELRHQTKGINALHITAILLGLAVIWSIDLVVGH